MLPAAQKVVHRCHRSSVLSGKALSQDYQLEFKPVNPEEV